MGWRGALAGREIWDPGKLQNSNEEDGGRGRQEGTLTGIQAAKMRRKAGRGGKSVKGVDKNKGKQKDVRENMCSETGEKGDFMEERRVIKGRSILALRSEGKERGKMNERPLISWSPTISLEP